MPAPLHCVYAAFVGDIDYLIAARRGGCLWEEQSHNPSRSLTFDRMLSAMEHYASEMDEYDKWYYVFVANPRGTANTCDAAAASGHLDCLRYAHENGCPWSQQTSSNAAAYGHVDCLEYAHKNGCPLDSYAILIAATNGNIDCLRYAHENGCEWDESTCHAAAEYGHLDCLRYAHENGCEWDESACRIAAENGHLDCVRYAQEHGCPWNKEDKFGRGQIRKAVYWPKLREHLLLRRVGWYWYGLYLATACASSGNQRRLDKMEYEASFAIQ